MSLARPTNALILSQICGANPAVETAVQSIQLGESCTPSFSAGPGGGGHFTQIAGWRYAGRTGDMHVEPFAAART